MYGDMFYVVLMESRGRKPPYGKTGSEDETVPVWMAGAGFGCGHAIMTPRLLLRMPDTLWARCIGGGRRDMTPHGALH